MIDWNDPEARIALWRKAGKDEYHRLLDEYHDRLVGQPYVQWRATLMEPRL
jgi:hypothetical protein